jgi:hypothetical protein
MSDLDSLLHLLRRSYPEYPSTFNPCRNECGNSARGSGLCAACIEDEIAKISSPVLAGKLHNAIVEQAEVIGQIKELMKK